MSMDIKNSNLLMPCSISVLTENVLLNESMSDAELESKLQSYLTDSSKTFEVAVYPTRILMQDYTGVPAIVDFVAMRDAAHSYGLQPEKIEPRIRIDLVVDHSVSVEFYADDQALSKNMSYEMKHNKERFELLKWADASFSGIRVIPPGQGICHQVNIEYLTNVITEVRDQTVSEFVIGTDSHTTMVNSLGVLGWGVGGIEAESCALGMPLMMNLPKVIGVELSGSLAPGVTATDLVLYIAEKLKKHNVLASFVEFYGDAVSKLDIPTRATIANMSPEFGSTCVYFPIDSQTISYLRITGRDNSHCMKVELYAKKKGLWGVARRHYHENLTIDLDDVAPAIAGPNKPHDRVSLRELPERLKELYHLPLTYPKISTQLESGDIVLAAITSCTNTSNPSVLIAAGLLARNALKKGLKPKSWVKTSFAPGSRAVALYLEEFGLLADLEKIGFDVVGYGCTTCIGNSGHLREDVAQEIISRNLSVNGVLSGNRNFSGRIHPLVVNNWLMSPPLVIAYALAGTMIDFKKQPLGYTQQGKPVMLADIWPEDELISTYVQKIKSEFFSQTYRNVFNGLDEWNEIELTQGKFSWQDQSTYIKKPPYINPTTKAEDLLDAPILALLGDFVTTDHISPAGRIAADSPAAKYLREQGVVVSDYNSYGARRGNFELMTRGTFANIRLQNKMVERQGGYTVIPSRNNELVSIYDASRHYLRHNQRTVVIAGKEYGSGSSRDWAAKGTYLLGVSVVLAQSFERIHRSNLIGMGVLPCEFIGEENAESWGIDGTETLSIHGISSMSQPAVELALTVKRSNGFQSQHRVLARVDSDAELNYYKHQGILSYVMKQMSLEDKA